MKLVLLLIISLIIFGNVSSHYINSRFRGQLGNQLFQIATAIAFALEHNMEAVFPNIFKAKGGVDNFERIFPKINISEFPKNYTELKEKKFRCYAKLPWKKNTHYFLNGYFQKDKDRFFLIKDNPRHIDLYLMSFCKHQIVSPDSTFSWLAAWLNENPNKVVISSKIDIERGQTDYIPESWIKL